MKGNNKGFTLIELLAAVVILAILVAFSAPVIVGLFDTSKCKCFKVPKGVPVEIYSTTLHYAPVSVNGEGFRVLICLPKGTNVDRVKSDKNKMLYASNKWLLAHKESSEAKDGAYIGLIGENIKIN